jgi:hypothetical protein
VAIQLCHSFAVLYFLAYPFFVTKFARTSQP